MTNENCPCKKKKCPRHGDCTACREHHAASKRQRPVACQRKPDIFRRKGKSNPPDGSTS